MNKILKLTCLILILSIFVSQIALGEEVPKAIEFSDLKEDYWAYEGINNLVNAKIIEGYPDGTFRPDNNITRAELVKIANLVFNYTQKQEQTSFTDVIDTEWYYEQVLIAQNAGYLDGYPDGTFKPNNNITREEFCKIIDAIVDLIELPGANKPVDEVSTWATEYVNKVLSNKIMLLDESNNFRAKDFATRAEVSDALAKFLVPESQEVAGGASGGGSNVSDSEEVNAAMEETISVLNDEVISSLNSDQAEIVNDIIDNMNNYMENNNYDYKAAADEIYNKYKEKLNEAEQDSLVTKIKTTVPTLYLIELKDFFFPEVDYKI
ncbi:MAG: S-layer homology domain-containing protein [Sedimentibacter sp.]